MAEAAGGNAQTGPDFLCIGAQKAGTGWLYEQLRSHPDFWMPPMKELHYFDRPARSRQRSLTVPRKDNDRIAIARERARDDRDYDFLHRFEQLADQPSLNLQGYGELFCPKGELLSGDITPGYSVLDDELVEKVVAEFPSAKVIFIARDPVERAWSQISMYVRRGLIDRFDPDNPEQISEQLRRPEIQARSYPSEIVRRWRHHVSADLFRVYLFDDLARNAADLRGSIMTFLGADPMKASGTLPAGYNAKAAKQKLLMTPTARTYLARFFETELKSCAAELGGAATDWPNRYGF